MTAAAAKAKPLLADSTPAVADFLLSQIHEDGGFIGRRNRSDLYYTMFGLEATLALDAPIPKDKIKTYLSTFTDVNSLDLIHLACLIRASADLNCLTRAARQEAIERLVPFRSADSGYNTIEDAQHASAYGTFIGLGLHQDLDLPIDNPADLIHALNSLAQNNGSYANEHTIAIGSVPATAAAVTILFELNQSIDPATTDWLLSQYADGGFRPFPAAPEPDLLSTATAIHALALAGLDLARIKHSCLEFIATLRNNGGFKGTHTDNAADCEYTYYALLALGHLAQA
jgi:hypothetical protein